MEERTGDDVSVFYSSSELTFTHKKSAVLGGMAQKQKQFSVIMEQILLNDMLTDL
uniref:Uncharacterized protein n=1 Tax=Magallana gigas TaxID=29159 RepID=K1RA13_MAGGI